MLWQTGSWSENLKLYTCDPATPFQGAYQREMTVSTNVQQMLIKALFLAVKHWKQVTGETNYGISIQKNTTQQ